MRQGAFVFCPECGRDNPLENRFCGMCGASLQNRPAAHQDAARDPEPPETTGSRIAGPSFLGLSESPSDTETGSYLLDDEPRRSRVGLLVLLLALVAVGAVFAYQRHYIELPSWLASRLHVQTPAAPATAPGNTAASSAAVPSPLASDTNEEPPAPMTQSDRPTSSTATQPDASATTKSHAASVPQDAAEEEKPASAPPETSASADDAADDNAEAEAAPATPKKPSPARLRADKEAAQKKQADDRLLVLGENYLYGRGGVAKNCDQALMYLRAAAGARNPKAMGHLGAMYATGNCVPVDRPTAYRWFTLARQADPANPWLESNRQMIWGQMTAAEQARTGGPQ